MVCAEQRLEAATGKNWAQAVSDQGTTLWASWESSSKDKSQEEGEGKISEYLNHSVL